MTTFRVAFNDSTARAVYCETADEIATKFDFSDTDFDASQLDDSDEVTIRDADGQVVAWVVREQ